MSARRTIWEWAVDYVGDPGSFDRRGQMILELLLENGLTAEHNVLDIGCGNLSDGAPLIRFLETGRFTGIEPNGWLVEAALQNAPDLEAREPKFIWTTDFDASSLGVRYDFIVAHSVLSHCAHWQLATLLANTRKVVDEGAKFLCSFINDQYNSFDESWVYPGVSTFRLPTVIAEGMHSGWHVEMRHDYKERMVAQCPNDTHDWLLLTAQPSMEELNQRRLDEEARQAEERAEKAKQDAARLDERLREDERRRREAQV